MSTVLVEPAYHTELIDGCEVEKPLPKNLHAFIQTFLGAALLARLPRRYRAATELNVLCGADRLVPDVTVMERSARYENGDLADPPVLAVEIMSPGQTLSDLVDRCERLHKLVLHNVGLSGRNGGKPGSSHRFPSKPPKKI